MQAILTDTTEKNPINSETSKGQSPQDQVQGKDNKSWLAPVLFFYAKVTSWIIAPVGIAILIVKMTEKDGLFFPAIIIGFLITVYGIYREIKEYKKTLK